MIGGLPKEVFRENTTTCQTHFTPAGIVKARGKNNTTLFALFVLWGPTDALTNRAVFAHLQHAARKPHAFPAFLICCEQFLFPVGEAEAGPQSYLCSRVTETWADGAGWLGSSTGASSLSY